MSPDSPVDIVVRNGSTVSLRAAVPDDAQALLEFLRSLSAPSLYFRFLGVPSLTLGAARQLIPDASEGQTLIAESGGRVLAFASFYRTPGTANRAEVAFAVADALQGQGLGTRLLERLADRARAMGIRTFDAEVLQNNDRMLGVFRSSGFDVTSVTAGTTARVELSIARTPRYEDAQAARARAAASASMRAFFEPRTVAVVGANRERGRIGSEILHNIVDAGFAGHVYPVHPAAAEIGGLKAYPTVGAIPGGVDLAMIVVPAARVLAAVDDCVASGVRALCIISAGFSESGPEGREVEHAILERVRRAGCRLVGPNCMGLVNTDPRVRLNATFSPVYPPAGHVAMSTQSGALGLAILDYARRLDIGISSFVSVGNKADVSGNDLIQYWAEDPQTSVILLYLESFGNPRKFSEIARRVGRMKPIVAVKSGRSTAGSRAASSHTGALATSDTVVDALFRQSGVIRTERLEELFDVASLLAHQPLPAGSRVAILTNAGGPGILAADACEQGGLDLQPLSEATQAELRSFLPTAASVGNPVDMLASAPPEHYERSLDAILRDERIHSVIAIFIPPLVTDPSEVAAAIARAHARTPDKPVLGVFMRAEGAPSTLGSIPSYAFPESAAVALARVTTYGKWRVRPAGTIPSLDRFDEDRIRALVAGILAREGGWCTPSECASLVDAAGIPAAASRVVTTADDAVAAAAAIGYPVALKAMGPALLHKTERHAVLLNLAGDDQVRAACADLDARLGADVTSLLVQAMVPGGIEMIVGALQDPVFGPLIACGTGGVLVDLLADTQFRLHPLTAADAVEMIEGLRGARLLRGFRGAPPADVGALQDVLLRVSALVTAAPEIQELDINPVIVGPSGATCADVRIRVEGVTPRRSGRRVEY